MGVGTRTAARIAGTAAGHEAKKGARTLGLWGLATRGALYLLLALLSVKLAVGNSRANVDTRGALHQLAHDGVGRVGLILLVVGFAGFCLWHVYVALVMDRGDASRLVGDLARAVAYGALFAIALSFLVTSKSSSGGTETDQTWTARVMSWSGGRLLVGAVGVAIIAGGIYLVWRAFSDRPQDEPAVLDAAPRETRTLHRLAAVGNVARGGVVAVVGFFLLDAAIEYDPDKTVGLDGALKRVLDASFGEFLGGARGDRFRRVRRVLDRPGVGELGSPLAPHAISPRFAIAQRGGPAWRARGMASTRKDSALTWPPS